MATATGWRTSIRAEPSGCFFLSMSCLGRIVRGDGRSVADERKGQGEQEHERDGAREQTIDARPRRPAIEPGGAEKGEPWNSW